MKNTTIKIICLSACFALSGCSDFLEIDAPKTQITSGTVFTTDASAESAVTGIYSTMMNDGSFASGSSASMTIFGGLSSDEYIDLANSTTSSQYYTNSVEATNSTLDNSWANLYQYIFYTNSILEGLEGSQGLSLRVKDQIEGEARFIRAFSYFYLVNLFGDVPLVMSTDFRQTATTPRNSVAEVYDQIIDDLNGAIALLINDYEFSEGERIRPNSFAASALLARAYLYMGRWADAETQATRVIAEDGLYGLEDNLNDVFLASSREAIWQLKPTSPGYNTFEATVFAYLGTVALSSEIVNVFEADDLRKTNWLLEQTSNDVVYQSPYKYKVWDYGQPLTEYSMVIRFAEVMLIRSEARIRNGNLAEAISDLNLIRQRAGLQPTTALTADALLAAIEQERRVELFSEWGHRWLDLKRTSRADVILGQLKAGWQSTDALYPIPKIERDRNVNLTQNPGY